MFARSCPRMGVRFASGNVFYMNKTFSARHLQSVASPLSTGVITPMRFSSRIVAGCNGALVAGVAGDIAVPESGELALTDGALVDALLSNVVLPMYAHMGCNVAGGALWQQSISSIMNIRKPTTPGDSFRRG